MANFEIDLPLAKDEAVEKIAGNLFRYLTMVANNPATFKYAIIEALSEARAVGAGEPYNPSIVINGQPVHHTAPEDVKHAENAKAAQRPGLRLVDRP